MPFRVKLNEQVLPGSPVGAEKGILFTGNADYYELLDSGVLKVFRAEANHTVFYAPHHWLYVETLDGQGPGERKDDLTHG